MKAPTFSEFLDRIYGMTMLEFDLKSDSEKQAAFLDYQIRYGKRPNEYYFFYY